MWKGGAGEKKIEWKKGCEERAPPSTDERVTLRRAEPGRETGASITKRPPSSDDLVTAARGVGGFSMAAPKMPPSSDELLGLERTGALATIGVSPKMPPGIEDSFIRFGMLSYSIKLAYRQR